jgi:uncharacterized protein YggT (Ycf19 family)
MLILDYMLMHMLKVVVEDLYGRLSSAIPELAALNKDLGPKIMIYDAWKVHTYTREIAANLLLYVPVIYIMYTRMTLEVIRFLIIVRYTIGWFPNFNPYGTIFEIIVVPVDTFIRPFGWFFPKFWFFEFSNWLPMFLIDSGIQLCKHIETVAWVKNLIIHD